MNQFLTTTLQSTHQFHAADFFIKLLLATLCGALLAFHPMYFKKLFRKPKRLNFAKAQVLICLCGAMMVIVIGDNVARAFGLFGLGAFIRFRTPIKKATDTAALFILIAVGMAVGIGLYIQTMVVMIFVYLLIFPLESLKVRKNDPSAKKDDDDAEEESDPIPGGDK